MRIFTRLDLYQKVSVSSGKTVTICMIFTARKIQEKCHEQNMDLCMTLVDVKKAFDEVSRNGLWKKWHSRFIAMVRQFHNGMQVRVQIYKAYCEPFNVTYGVKQVCPTAIFCGCTDWHVSNLVENRFPRDVGHVTNKFFRFSF